MRKKYDIKEESTKIVELLDINNYFKYETLIGNLPYIMFLVFLAILYIGNIHFAEKTIRKINKSEKEFKEVRWEYMSIKSELMYKSKQSQIAKSVENLGLQELTKPPGKIIVNKHEY